jgi:hypothetical protein
MAAATGGRWLAIGATAALLVGAGAGCAQESDGDLVAAKPIEFAASPDYVASVVDATRDTSYRYSMSISFGMGGQSFDADIATGAFDGERSQVTMDFGAMLQQIGGMGEEVPSELADADLTMEQVVDEDAIYLRAPFFSAMADQVAGEGSDIIDMTSEPGGALFGIYDQLGDGWGRIDVDALGDVLPADVQETLGGGQNADPRVFLDMLRNTESVEDLGTDEIDGDEVHGLAADVDLGDLLKASGTDPDDIGGGTTDELGDFTAFSFPLEVWIDGDDHVRRIDFTFGADSFTDLAEQSGQDIGDMPDELADFSMGMTMDFADYGDDSISIEAPSDAVDITDDFVAAYEDLTG